VTVTRTLGLGRASLVMLIGPFSALIRRLALRIVKSDAERRPGLTSARPPDA